MRVGDKSKKLTFEERTQLIYDKGERFFEDKPVPKADIEDIVIELPKHIFKKIDILKAP